MGTGSLTFMEKLFQDFRHARRRAKSPSKRGPALRHHHIFFWMREEVIRFSAFAKFARCFKNALTKLISYFFILVKWGELLRRSLLLQVHKKDADTGWKCAPRQDRLYARRAVSILSVLWCSRDLLSEQRSSGKIVLYCCLVCQGTNRFRLSRECLRQDERNRAGILH